MADTSRIEELRRRVQRDPASIAFAQLAEEYRRAGRFAEAIDTCEQGLAHHPGYLSARVTLGRSLLETGELDGAQLELKQVLRAAPENLAALRGLAEIHHRRGELQEALAHYRTALEFARQDPELEHLVEEIAKQLEPQAGAPVVVDGMSFEEVKDTFLNLSGDGQDGEAAPPAWERPAGVETAEATAPDVPLDVVPPDAGLPDAHLEAVPTAADLPDLPLDADAFDIAPLDIAPLDGAPLDAAPLEIPALPTAAPDTAPELLQLEDAPLETVPFEVVPFDHEATTEDATPAGEDSVGQPPAETTCVPTPEAIELTPLEAGAPAVAATGGAGAASEGVAAPAAGQAGAQVDALERWLEVILAERQRRG